MIVVAGIVCFWIALAFFVWCWFASNRPARQIEDARAAERDRQDRLEAQRDAVEQSWREWAAQMQREAEATPERFRQWDGAA